MREIEYRAYCKSQKRMLSFEHLKQATKGMVDIANKELVKSEISVNKLSPYGLFLPLEDDDLVFIQYTGLCDKNGKKIFEGDIVKRELAYITIIGKISWDERYLQYRIDCLTGENKGKFWWLTSNSEDYELLGNIYDNPELLEVKNDRK